MRRLLVLTKKVETVAVHVSPSTAGLSAPPLGPTELAGRTEDGVLVS